MPAHSKQLQVSRPKPSRQDAFVDPSALERRLKWARPRGKTVREPPVMTAERARAEAGAQAKAEAKRARRAARNLNNVERGGAR